MKNKKNVMIICLIIIILLLVLFIFLNFNKKISSFFEYDILIEEHRYEYEGVPESLIPEGGYSTNYYYKVINSKKKEMYTVTYQDIWEVHNSRGDKDTITILIDELSDSEVNEFLKKYGYEKKSRLEDLINKNIKEEYKIEKVIRN